MLKRWIAVCGFLLAAPAWANVETVSVPDQGWRVSYDFPQWKQRAESNDPQQYKYQASSGNYAVSFYVEPPGCSGGDTHEANYKCFVEKTKAADPRISIRIVSAELKSTYYRVETLTSLSSGDRSISIRSVHFLFAYRGKWADFHVSVTNPGKDDDAVLDRLEKSFSYGEQPKS